MAMEKNNNRCDESSNNYKVKLMCSYGGKIQPRSPDHQLSYLGGDTKILTVDRTVKFADVLAKMTTLCDLKTPVCLKYQLPGEDLDTLVSITDDDDLEHMMVEYDRIRGISTKPARLRLFLFTPNPPAAKTGLGSQLNPDFLFGFDEEYQVNPPSTFEIPGIAVAGNHGSDCQGSVIFQTKIQEMTTGQGSRDCHGAPLVYRVPVAFGAYPGLQNNMMGIDNREQPVYSFIPIMPPATEQNVHGDR